MAAIATDPTLAGEQRETAWRGFGPGMWQSRVNVRNFIQRNYTPYEGDGKFLEGATQRTRDMWQGLQSNSPPMEPLQYQPATPFFVRRGAVLARGWRRP